MVDFWCLDALQLTFIFVYIMLINKIRIGKRLVDSNQCQSKLENFKALLFSSENEVVTTTLR